MTTLTEAPPIPTSGSSSDAAVATRKKPTGVYSLLSLAFTDLAMMTLAFLIAYRVRFESGLFLAEEMHTLESYVWLIGLQAALTPVVFAVQGLYRPRRTVSWLDRFYGVFAAASITIALVLVVSAFIARDFDFSRLMIALAWVFSILLVSVGRGLHGMVLGWLRAHGVTEDRVIIVGSGDIAQLVLERIRSSPHLGYRPIGFVVEISDLTSVDGVPVLGQLEDIGRVIRETQANEVIVALPTLSHQRLLQIVERCRGAQVGIKVFPDLFQIMASEVSIDDLNGLPLVTVRDVALKGWNLVLKRAMDLVISSACLVLLSPLMLFIALAIKITSPNGPVFYVQERVGLDGKPFATLKFRTMIPNAEQETGPVWATQGDPRRTRLGAFLRKTSLDELPQLINVLMGDMSLVGPRPERPFFVEQFRCTIPRYFERHQEKAGLTGWAQVNGLRGNTSIEERTAYDLWYVENWTPWLDLKILVRTCFIIFRDKNAC